MNTQASAEHKEAPGAGMPHDVHTTVEYLPAAKPFHKEYSDETTAAIIRNDAMAFFGVSDHQDRDKHQFFLVFNGQRLTGSETLIQLLGPHREGAKFDLVEQITPGGSGENE